MTHVTADKRRCASIRQCVSVAPDYFGVDPVDGRVAILRSPVPQDQIDLVDEAIEFCPMQALAMTHD